ncbi:hypothetical protein [Aporhodopirellula aestuarii]|uniref:Uncharacterized protein n=1 Tax=Aporhodopirellula aestuarii TaxID=2950107 RepID=A0ABT0UBT6_9BACT|nr:hypothetical protein [Aporhodopirellula aestuarii]MCM2373960.1 hypothetical protein [Aporhodopirellula aestuarii]
MPRLHVITPNQATGPLNETYGSIANMLGMTQFQGVHLPLKFMLGVCYRNISFEMEKNL